MFYKRHAKKVILMAIEHQYITKKDAVKLLNMVKYGRLTCALCKRPMGKHSKKTIDHIYPKSKGGTNEIENLQIAHFGCNVLKSDKI